MGRFLDLFFMSLRRENKRDHTSLLFYALANC